MLPTGLRNRRSDTGRSLSFPYETLSRESYFLLLQGSFLKAERVGAVQPGEEKAVGRPYSSLPVPEGAYRKDGENLFSRAYCDRTRSNGFKVREGRFRLAIRKKFFTIRVVKYWNRLPGEVVKALSLEIFKAWLDGTLSNLV